MNAALAVKITHMQQPETLGQAVIRRRGALRLTQRQLAKEAGVSESTVRNVEHDIRSNATKARFILNALDRLEAELVQTRPSGLLDAALANGEVMDVRTRQRGRVREVSAFIKPSDMPDAEFWALIDEMHKNRQDPRD